jgi:RNA-splicing ligase RtcB
LIDGLPTYNGVISINENDKLVFTPETELTGESNLEVSVIMNVLDVDQTAKFGIYPETYTFFIVETGETITLDYEPGQPYSE